METGNITTADGFKAAYTEVFTDVYALTADLDDRQALAMTGCPGWTVRDHVAHIVDLESILVGRQRPNHSIPGGLPYIRNEPGEFMEIGVDARRGMPYHELIAEYRDVSRERLARLDDLDDSQLDAMGQGFFGPSKVRSLLAIRVFDLWAHEQDLRRALGRPGGFGGIPAAHSRERMMMGAGNNLQGRLAPPAGTSLLFEITGTGGARRAIVFDGERGRSGMDVPEIPTATLRLDLNTLTVLACGRSDDPLASSRVVVEGVQNLGRRALEDLSVTP
ncbi:MAG TPA: maleylpyruvate isomerase family mycothiol-dependent enzyme [Candidatus Saccharimonadales bacterium]|nr:maleylpyruvate isomerase family mycothiol-dependent enzyme [Candidatus Saccharimonadales bacterium]